jgi:hypothetical protein
MHSGVARATYDDVRLILTASFKAKTTEEFAALCPPGSEQGASFRMVTTYWEMVASFLTTGVLNAELFYQSGRELLFVWERVRDLLPQIREQCSHPHELRNLETAAKAYIDWWNKQAPGAYDAFSKRTRG